MKFYARIKPTSTVFNRWKARNALGGMVDSVSFKRQMDGNYLSGVLTAKNVERLRNCHAVVLMMAGIEPQLPPEPPVDTPPVPTPSTTFAGAIQGRKKK